jgi:phenylacetate-CoA ligase
MLSEVDKVKISLFFAKYTLYNQRAKRYYRELLSNQSLSEDEMSNYNWLKRKKLLEYAYEKIPYYKRKFTEAGVAPPDIVTPSDYSLVPLLTKEEIRVHFDELVSPGIIKSDVELSSTGGSTGVPLKVFHDRRFPSEALGWRMLHWWGLAPGVDAGYIWRLRKPKPFARLLNMLIWWPTRRIRLDASLMTEDSMAKFVKSFNHIRPKLLQGYVGAVDNLASYIDSHNLHIHEPNVVWLTSSPISATQRLRIERVFHAPVYDQYGCGEVFWIAAQCREKRGLHVFADARHVEILDDSGNPCSKDEIGKIVITDLENYAFPIIRYINGDLGRPLSGNCACGLHLPLMDNVKGRVTDLIRLPDGTVLSGDYLTTIFDDFPDAVQAFRVHQKIDYSISLNVVPNKDYSTSTQSIQQVHLALQRKVGGQVPVNLVLVDAIPDKQGKNRFVISDIMLG